MRCKGWKEQRLSDIASITMGQSPKGSTCNNVDGIPLLNGPTEFGTNYPVPTQYTVEPKKISQKGDLLFCVRGSTTGRMNWADQTYAIGRGLAAISPIYNNTDRFVKAMIEFKLPEILKMATGSTFPNVSKTLLNDFLIFVPEEHNMVKINLILKSIEDKIETNNQINKTLEKMAQTIFKHWFVDFEFPNENGEPYKSSGGEMVESELKMIPKGWEVKQLNDIASMKNGVNYSREQEGNEIKVVNVRDFDGSLIVNKSKLDSILLIEKQINDYLLEKYDTVVVRSAKPGETLLVLDSEEVVYSGFTIRVRANEKLLKLFIFYSIRNAMRMLNNSSNGTVFKNLNQQILGSLKVIVPKSNIIDMYSSLIISLLELINQKIKETDKLTQLRDTLLPKLMSGEIRVPLEGVDTI